MSSDIHKHLTIAAPIDRVWAALSDPHIIQQWMGDDQVQVDLKVGGRYTFFGGQTSGRFSHIAAPILLEYTWRQQNWPAAWEDSLVRWELHTEPDGTRLHLIHSRFPNKDERSSHDEGWEMYWLGPMRGWLEHR